MDKPVNFAVVGTSIGRYHLQGISNIPSVARLAGVCDINEDRAREMAEKYQADFYTTDFNELLRREDVDAITLAVPHDLHHSMAVAAANAGKHILVEKPIATTLEQADEVIAAAKKNNVKLMIGHNMRYLGQYAKAKELVEQDVIGKPYLLTATVHVYSNTGGFRTILKHLGGGALIDSGVHRFDLIRWIMGDIKRVYGKIGTFLNMQMEGEDTAVLVMEFESGAIGTFSCSWVAKAYEHEETLQIFGTKGSVLATYYSPTLKVRSDTPPEGWQNLSEFTYSIDQPMSMQMEIEDFARSIINDEQPPVTGEDGRKSLELTLATYHASKTGQPVDLPMKS
ncbi:MAG: Gfo/Idh/MocA family oxidoreductase [Anaerolineales bacterium]|nr:Gfo/Idh/MocA family oxidoreductase [Anaerolineales bacterium]